MINFSLKRRDFSLTYAKKSSGDLFDILLKDIDWHNKCRDDIIIHGIKFRYYHIVSMVVNLTFLQKDINIIYSIYRDRYNKEKQYLVNNIIGNKPLSDDQLIDYASHCVSFGHDFSQIHSNPDEAKRIILEQNLYRECFSYCIPMETIVYKDSVDIYLKKIMEIFLLMGKFQNSNSYFSYKEKFISSIYEFKKSDYKNESLLEASIEILNSMKTISNNHYSFPYQDEYPYLESIFRNYNYNSKTHEFSDININVIIAILAKICILRSIQKNLRA